MKRIGTIFMLLFVYGCYVDGFDLIQQNPSTFAR